MPDLLEITIDGAIVRVAVSGDMTSARYGETINAVYKTHDFQPGMGILLDLRKASPADMGFDAIRDMHAFNVSTIDQRGDSAMALLISSDLGFGLSRMAEMLGATDDIRIGVFRDETLAREWLIEVT